MVQSGDFPIKHRYNDFGKDRVDTASWVLTVRDAYNLVYVYTMIHDWITENGWAIRDDPYFPETFYLQREHPVNGKELWIRWRLSRLPSGAKAGLFSYTMDLDWHMVGLKSAEVAWKGQKIKADRGEFELTCRAAVVVDKSKEWTSWPFNKIKDFFIRRVRRKELERHKVDVYTDAYRLRDLVSSYMKQETFMPVKEVGEFFVKRTLE